MLANLLGVLLKEAFGAIAGAFLARQDKQDTFDAGATAAALNAARQQVDQAARLADATEAVRRMKAEELGKWL